MDLLRYYKYMLESFPEQEKSPIPEKPLIEKRQIFDMYKISGKEDARFREILIAYLGQRQDLLHDDELESIKEEGKRNEHVRETIEWNIEKAEMFIEVGLLDEAQETIEDIIDGVKDQKKKKMREILDTIEKMRNLK